MVSYKIGVDILLVAGSAVDNQDSYTTIAPTFSSLDESLHLLQRFLCERLDEQRKLGHFSKLPPRVFDLGILGLRDYGEKETQMPVWQGQEVYPLRLYRSQILLGPFYRPDRAGAPCPRCLERRWFWNLAQEEQKAFIYARQTSVFGHNPRLTAFALEGLWLLLASLLQRVELEAQAQAEAYPFYVFHLETFQIDRYFLIQDSNCPICALPVLDRAELAHLPLVSRPKQHENNYRLHKATDYRLPVEGLVNPVTGVLGREMTTNPVNALVPISGTFRIRERYHVREAWWRGHGHTEQQGRYLGLLEGLERYAGHVPRARQTQIFASYEQLAPDALDPRACGLYQSSFYEKNAPFYQSFTPTRTMPWVWGYSYREQRPLLVPEQLVYYVNYQSEYPSMVQDCSSGCAIGGCLEEAMLYGLLELIERDTFLLSWYARLGLPRIDPQSCQHPETLFLLEAIAHKGYELSLFDTRLDMAIPSVMGVARLKEPGPGNLMLTAGCSLNPEDAIHKTLCEIASHVFSFPEMVTRRLDELRAMAQDFSQAKGLAEYGLLFGLPEMAPHTEFLYQNPGVKTLEETYREWNASGPHHLDLLEDLSYCMETVFKLGLDIIVVDQTCPEQVAAGLKTVCVIVPGLLPMDFGWQRDRVLELPRLRTVPRTTGYRQTDFIPDVQNVIPHPFP